MEDRELVALLKAGNIDAFEHLIMRWRSRTEAYAFNILHDSQSAEDAIQEAFSRIYALRDGLNENCSFSAYLFTIVRRICIDELRKRKHSPDLPGVLPDLPIQSAEEEYLSHWKRLNRIHLLATLNDADRKVLLAYSMEGKTTRQIAKEMKLAEGLIRVRLHRIRRKLKGMSNDEQ